MGSGNSKPAAAARPGEHVFTGETPVRFSNELVESLQGSAENDSTRAKALELHIQSRVSQELARLEARESQLLSDIEARLPPAENDETKDLGKARVKAEIERLRAKLEQMPKIGELSSDVNSAREEVARCLRDKETRPLDCWREVETFKERVRAMERGFVVRTVGREY